jgi:hypothetical protein
MDLSQDKSTTWTWIDFLVTELIQRNLANQIQKTQSPRDWTRPNRIHDAGDVYNNKWHTRLQQLPGNMYISGANKNNNDNTTTPIILGLNKTTQKIRTPREECSARYKSDVLEQMYFNKWITKIQ